MESSTKSAENPVEKGPKGGLERPSETTLHTLNKVLCKLVKYLQTKGVIKRMYLWGKQGGVKAGGFSTALHVNSR
jgi:hypothetical protein